MTELIKRLITSIILGTIFWFAFIMLSPIYFSLILIGILCFIIFFEWRTLFNITGLSYWLILPLYPILPFALLIYLNQHPMYHALLLDLFILVASFDTGSYIGGTLFGKHPIIPKISPKKTWEGVLCGYIFATIGFILLIRYEQGKLLPWHFMLGFSAVICLLSFLGDLFESWLKRRAQVKHSGNSLPGHGGFLDRFDGIMFAVFFFYIFKNQLVPLLG
jgi:phosphatidate cytidylyltransferase